MNDYIRTAVELADGWYVRDNGSGACPFVPERPVNLANPGPFADLLAAQLERQFNAYCAEDSRWHMFMWTSYVTAMREQPLGTDLTMWRIKAIVDSGVLE